MAEARRSTRLGATRRYWLPALTLVVGVALAIIVAGITLAGVQRNALPEFVLKWNGHDAGAQASLAEQLVAAGAPQDADRRKAIRLATAALLRDPTQVKAARALGMVAAVEGRSDHAERLFAYAESLSRRDVPTQLWFIERKVQTGDVQGILRHYDAVLRTSPTGQDLLFPVLARAADEPAVYAALKDLLAQNPPWARAFVTRLLSSRGNAGHISGLALAVLDGSQKDDEVLRQRFVSRLVDRREYDVAFSTYASLTDAVTAQLLVRNGDFEQPSPYPPIDWEFAADTDLAALSQSVSGRDGIVLRFHASAGMGGPLARQLLRLPAGDYRLAAVVANIPADPTERPSLELRCADRGSDVVLQTVEFPPGGPEGRDWQFVFEVPMAHCSYQWLTIKASGTLNAPADIPWIDRLTLEPVS